EHEGDQRLDQPLAQLDQVLHQRRLGGLDLLLVVFGRLHAALPPSGVATGLGSGAAGAAGVAGVAGAASTKSSVRGGGGNSGIGTSTMGSGATGAVPSATGS